MRAQTRQDCGTMWLLIGAGIGLAMCSRPAAMSAAEQEAARASRPGVSSASQELQSSATSGSSSKADAKKNGDVDKKLDEILANQQAIFQRLDQVMEELRIIKVRATSRGSS